MTDLKINYTLLRIDEDTDRMALTFLKSYINTSAECKLHVSNKFYNEACTILAASPILSPQRGTKKRGLLFEELQLGTSYDSLKHLVVRSVSDSASRNASLSAAPTLVEMNKANQPGGKLSILRENEDNVNDDLKEAIETDSPQWSILGWFNETLVVVEGFSPDVVVQSASTLDYMMGND